jgi:hypothetical protein
LGKFGIKFIFLGNIVQVAQMSLKNVA